MKFLIVGLGNIGEEYVFTRHNIGFEIVDTLAKDLQASFQLERHAFHAHQRLKGRSVHLIKPTTYMNLSGKAVHYWMNQLKIAPENILIALDDVALPFGTTRIRKKGSDGGHNGLRHIIELLHTQEFPRLRFGIGSHYAKGRQVDYVLSRWTREEEKALPEKIQYATEAIKSCVTIGIERTMNVFNTKE